MNYTEFKKRIKKNKLVLKLYSSLFSFLYSLDPMVPMEIPIKIYYYIIFGKKLDLENPLGLNEKIQWLKTYYRDPLYVICTDKYQVREYVISRGLGDILNELYGVYYDANKIDFLNLPNKFALKATHGCSMNLICEDKSILDLDDVKVKANEWLKIKNGKSTGEKHYLHIKPRLITERYIGNEDGTLPIDYKIYCFNGEPYCVAVYSDRDKITLKTNRCYFDFDWNPLDIVTEEFYTEPSRFSKPVSLNKMYDIAKKLSEPFPFVRVDLYEYKGNVIFGELTFTPTGGYGKAFTKKANLIFGQKLLLPEKSKSRSYK